MKIAFKENLFFQTFFYILKNKSSYLLALFFDAIFLVSISVLGILLKNLFNFKSLNDLASLMLFIMLAILYYLLLILVYSLFKYLIIKKIIKEMPAIKDFFRFFFLNTFLLFISIILFFTIAAVLYSSLKENTRPIVLTILAFISLFFFYPFFNYAEFYFLLTKKTKFSLIKAFKNLSKIRNYIAIYGSFGAVLSIYLVLFYLTQAIIFYTARNNKFVGIIDEIVFTVVGVALFYLALGFNRFYFYLSIKKEDDRADN